MPIQAFVYIASVIILYNNKQMSKTFLFILILSAIQLTGYGQTNWSTYTSKEGHYSVSLPGKPTENVQYDSSSGTILAIHLCMLESVEDGVFISSRVGPARRASDGGAARSRQAGSAGRAQQASAARGA